MGSCSNKNGRASGKKTCAGKAVAEPAPEAPERGLKGTPMGYRSIHMLNTSRREHLGFWDCSIHPTIHKKSYGGIFFQIQIPLIYPPF